jgi:hypothetical protein
MDKQNKRLVWELETGRFGSFPIPFPSDPPPVSVSLPLPSEPEGLYINDIAEIRPPTENSFTFRVRLSPPHSLALPQPSHPSLSYPTYSIAPVPLLANENP